MLFNSNYLYHISMNIILKNRHILIVKYIYNFRGTCSSVEMLKWYVIRERLKTPALDNVKHP